MRKLHNTRACATRASAKKKRARKKQLVLYNEKAAHRESTCRSCEHEDEKDKKEAACIMCALRNENFMRLKSARSSYYQNDWAEHRKSSVACALCNEKVACRKIMCSSCFKKDVKDKK